MPLGAGPCLFPRARDVRAFSSAFLPAAGGGSSSLVLRLRSGSRSEVGGLELEGLFEETLVLPEACLLRVIGILWRDERCDERLRMSCARDASGERKPRRLHWNAQAQGSKRGTRRRATGKKREEQSLEIVQSRSQERSSAPRCRGPGGVVSSAEVDKKLFLSGTSQKQNFVKKSRRGEAARAMLDINLLREEKGGNPEIVRESQRRRFADVSLVDQVESCHSCSAQLGHQPPPKHSHSAMRLCIES